jgi:cell division ATPase FtsA
LGCIYVYGGKEMTVVCVDDHSVMLKGTKKSVEQILPDASIVAFTDADKAHAFVKDNGCDILITEIELFGTDGLTLAKKVKKVNCSEVVEIIEARCEQILEIINSKLEEIGAKQYVREVVLIGSGFNTVSKIDILANQIFNLPVSLVNFKQTNQLKPINTTAYSMQEYVLSGESKFNNKLSTIKKVEEKEKNGIFSKIVEKIQDFLYT